MMIALLFSFCRKQLVLDAHKSFLKRVLFVERFYTMRDIITSVLYDLDN